MRQMSLSPIVELFRASGPPEFTSGRFSAELRFNGETRNLIENVWKQNPGVFEELLVDGREVLDNDPLPSSGVKFTFTVQPPQNSSSTFHLSLNDFIKTTPQISRGQIPSDYYLVNENYYSEDNNHPKKIINLSIICKIIDNLSRIAHYHDTKTSADHFKLVFFQPGGAKNTSPVELDTKVTEEILSYDAPDLSIIDNLSKSSASIDPHYNEKIGVFWSTLTEFMKNDIGTLTKFSYLIKNWSLFIDNYQNNLGTYLSGFAFHKAKREVAEAEFQIADQFAKVISEIAGKLLSIPVSFAVVIAITKTSSAIEGPLLVCGLLLASTIIAGAVRNQQKQLERIDHAKTVIFDAIEGKCDSYPEKLQESVADMKNNLNKNEVSLRRLLWVYRTLSWAPAIVGVFIYAFNNRKYLSFSLFKESVSFLFLS